MRDRCLVVIPTYNEVQSITVLVRAIIKVDKRVDVLVVDDSSPDGTAQVIKTEFLSDDRVSILVRKERGGIGSAYVDGFLWALERGYGFVMEMDADFAHKPEYIPYFLNEIEYYDLVLGSRYVPGGKVVNWDRWRRFMYRFGASMSKMILGAPISDLTGGFKCFRTDLFKEIDLRKVNTDGYSFQIELTYLAYLLGKRVIEIPIIFEDRRVGKSKLPRKEVLKAWLEVPRLRMIGKHHPALKK